MGALLLTGADSRRPLFQLWGMDTPPLAGAGVFTRRYGRSSETVVLFR